jgi:hypothetical protein
MNLDDNWRVFPEAIVIVGGRREPQLQVPVRVAAAGSFKDSHREGLW